MDAVHDIALLIAAETDLDRVLERVLRSTEALLGAASSSVYFRELTPPFGRRFTTIGGGVPRWASRTNPVRPNGITDRVMRERRCVAIENVQTDPRASPTVRERATGAVLAAPLHCQDDVIGVLYANFDEPRRFTAAEIELLETLGAHAATAVRNARLIATERRAAHRQSALFEMARALSLLTGVDRTFQTITHHTCAVLEADEALILRLHPDGTVQGVEQPQSASAPDLCLPWQPGPILQQALASPSPTVIVRPAESNLTTPRFVEYLQGVELAVVAPLMADPECLGLVVVLWRRPHETDPSELQMIETIASLAAVAVQKARAHEADLAAARLDGAIKTAQAAAHELSQPLSVIVGYGELLEDIDEPQQIRRFATSIGRAGREASRKLDRFRKVMRYVELRFGALDPILDVERAAVPEDA